MRERAEDAVAQRLRSVLTGPEGARPAPAALPPGRRPAGTRQGVTPLGATPAPSSARSSALAGLATAGEPLSWADIMPAWPADVDLEAPTGFPPGSAWATPPGDLRSSHLGDVLPGTEPVSPAPRSAPPSRLPPPGWVLPEPADQPAAPGGLPAGAGFDGPAPSEEPALSGAGAFGGPVQDGRRFGLRAFDPGRRGVKALAAVAAAVMVLAAVLAWRSRPRLDPVAPPDFGVPGSAAATARAGPSASGAMVVVAVGGKVRKPGLVRLAPGARVADALTAAGGADPGVDVAMLNLARKVVDGELILVGVTPPPGAVPAAAPPGAGPAAPGGPVNLNTATLADLDALPGVGPVLAQRILDARDAQGGFRAVGDLRHVDGIGDARYEQLKDLVTV